VSGVETDRAGRPVIVLTEPIAETGLEVLSGAGRVHVVGSTDLAALAPALAGADALVVRSSPVTAELLDLAPHLRVVGRHGAGLDNIDLAAARRRGIAVVNTPGANAASVAEFVILAALALARRLVPARAAFGSGSLSAQGSLPAAVVRSGLSGGMLHGRTLGLVGLGAIGTRVAAYARGLGMQVVACDPAVTRGPEGVRLGDLAMVLGASDVLSLHVPLVPATSHLIDASAIEQMRAGALLVNTARGGVVDEDAVLAALDSRQLGGYAVDVYDPEPPPADLPVLNHPAVLATPHMAAMTSDALAEMARSVASGVVDVLAGRTPPHLVPDPTEESR
jgi:phosphoglycerate dehydrogenase-like enzyme